MHLSDRRSGHGRGGPVLGLSTIVLVAGAVAALVVAGLVWNASLRRQVATTTAGLRAELGERRRAEMALRRSEHKLALHLEQTLVGVIEIDPQFRVVYWNPAAERIFGWKASEVLGKEAIEFLSPPAATAQAVDLFGSLLVRSDGRHNVNQNCTRDGRTITCEWFDTTLVDDDGVVSPA
jgi:PAS domain S-box-containing protein